MPGGHASHKGHSVKPNTNANDSLDTAADPSVDPQEILGEGADSIRAREAEVNPAAVERPKDQEQQK